MEEKEKKEKTLSFLRVMKLNAPEWKSVTVGCLLAAITGFSQPLIFVVFGDLFGEMSNPDMDVLMQTTKKVALIFVGIGVAIFLCTVGAATGQKIAIILQSLGGVLLAVIMGFYYEWRCALVAVAFIPLLAIAIYYEMKATKIESEATIKSLESSTKVAVEAVSNIRTTMSLGLEPYILRTYEENLVPVLSLMRRTSRLRGLVEGLSRSLLYFLGTALLTYGGHLIVSDAVRYENLLVSFQTLQIALATSQQSFSFLKEVHKGSLAATRIINMLNIEPSMRNPEVPVITPFISKGTASFKEVEFRYPTRRGQKVLQGLNLLVEDGKTFALVGESGCGKSTVINLLQRYYDPDSGIVALENIPLPQLLMHEVRANLGLVSQEPVLFHRTVWENIAYGDNSRTPTHMEVEDAAKAANIHSFIVTLPQGYETNLGTKGLQLSGGQKQRVAIARALIRKPKILLLDEATSALDTESEKIVQEALNRAKAGRTCLMIAHRLSTVRDADAICVLKQGRLVEQGTHAELMAKNGYYYRLHQNM